MQTELSQRLKLRHVNMIAMGGSIGTGIFLASGYTISVGGPAGALIAYSLMALIVYFLMTSLGEMSAYKPTSGSFCEYSTEYVGKSFGVAVGYNYWLNWALTIAAEISAAALIMSYWFPTVNSFIFSLIFFFLVFAANIFSVRLYGEIEYVMSFIKVAVIIVFIALGAVAVFQQPQFGAGNWTVGDAPFHNNWLGFISVFLFAGFSFQGTELIGVASGETQNAAVTIPKSIKYVFWRLTLFYIVSIAIITLLIPYNDPNIAIQDKVNMSPYTLVFGKYISNYAADVVNFVILVAVLSAANASMYSSTRTLWYLGKTGQAPKFFSHLSKHSVPIFALVSSALIGCLAFLSSVVANGVVFSYLLQISSLSGFIAWFAIALSHYKFRKAYVAKHGSTEGLPYKAKFYPYAQLIAMLVVGAVIIGQFIPVISGAKYGMWDLIITYSSVIIFLLFYFGHKLIYGNK